ncbi:hypothetical protein EON80_32365 [bacterium]|nr:MAG: hypothetical protein EON80_32365 [bacterium]
MSFLSFFARRFLTGAVARGATNFLTRRFKMSPGVANIAFVVLTELLARAAEQPGRFPKRATAKRP